MAGQLTGANTELVIGFESAYGVPETTGYKISYAPTSSASTTQALNESTVITGDPSPTEPFLGFKDGQVSLTLPLESKAFGYILKGLFGAPTTTGVNPYTHVFKRGSTIPSMWVEINHTDGGGGLFYLTKGVGLNEMSFSLGGDGELLVTITGIGQDTTKATSTVATTIINDVTDGTKFSMFQAAITGTTAKFKTFDLNFNNNIDPDTFILNGTGTRTCVVPSVYSATGSFTSLFEDDLLYADARANTTKQLTATLTSGADSIEFDLEETKLNAITNGEITTPNGLEASFDYQGFFSAGANATALQVTLINDTSTYA